MNEKNSTKEEQNDVENRQSLYRRRIRNNSLQLQEEIVTKKYSQRTSLVVNLISDDDVQLRDKICAIEINCESYLDENIHKSRNLPFRRNNSLEEQKFILANIKNTKFSKILSRSTEQIKRVSENTIISNLIKIFTVNNKFQFGIMKKEKKQTMEQSKKDFDGIKSVDNSEIEVNVCESDLCQNKPQSLEFRYNDEIETVELRHNCTAKNSMLAKKKESFLEKSTAKNPWIFQPFPRISRWSLIDDNSIECTKKRSHIGEKIDEIITNKSFEQQTEPHKEVEPLSVNDNSIDGDEMEQHACASKISILENSDKSDEMDVVELRIELKNDNIQFDNVRAMVLLCESFLNQNIPKTDNNPFSRIDSWENKDVNKPQSLEIQNNDEIEAVELRHAGTRKNSLFENKDESFLEKSTAKNPWIFQSCPRISRWSIINDNSIESTNLLK